MKIKSLTLFLVVFVILHSIFFTGMLYAAVTDVNYDKSNLGVFGGIVHDVASYDNAGTSEILIGVDSIRGIYKWDSGSSEWQQVTYMNPNLTGTDPIVGEGTQIEANLVSSYEDNIYAIINEHSSGPTVYCSDDGGDSWDTIISTINNPSVLVAHTSGIYIGTWDGDIYRNTTGECSGTFSLIYTASTTASITSIAVYDTDNYYVMGVSGSSLSVFDKVDSTSITDISGNLNATSCSGGTVEVHAVGVDPTDVDTIFIAGSSALPQVYMSEDGGTTYTASWDSNCSDFFPGGYPHYIKFNNNRVFISKSVLEKSAGSWSTTWDQASILSSTVGTSTITTNPNDGALEISPVDNTIVYLGTDWGLGQTTHTSGIGWGTTGFELGNNNEMDSVILNDIDFYEYSATSKELWIAAKSGAGRAHGYDPTDSTTSDDPSDWIFPIYPDNDGAPLTEVSIDPDDPDIVFLGNNGAKIYKTTDGRSTTLSGFSWSQAFDVTMDDTTNVFGTTTPEHSTITSINVLHTSSCDRIYFSGYNWETNEDGGIFYSDDDGSTWTADTIDSTSTDINFPVNTLYVTDLKVWAGVGNDKGTSTERGLRWRLSLCGSSSFWTPTTGTDLDNEVVTSIDGRYDNTGTTTVNRVYVATKGGVYRGDKPASTWTWQDVSPLSSSTDFTSVVVNPGDEDNAYVSVENCIYETLDGGSNWSTLSGTCGDSNEDVNVLKYDDLLAGTANGLYSFESTSESNPPVPDIKANGSDGPVSIGLNDSLSLTLELDSGSSSGNNADWWVVSWTPFGWYYYDLAASWKHAGSSLTNLSVTYQGTLFDLAPYSILNMSGLPTETYTFFFAIDLNADGNLDTGAGQLYYDSVDVTVQ